eukprot:gnl/TRDRNA2_/TRDRNA2_107212_c1_seq1.p1 gnl/TRDRNA2_/TRDRNA2_107212_c1~~gnl/TRDRNA2_/TRDRNA2_107212_c1_seq1.p1  ORF type:complete len:277 (+),score=79.84 gnl/TRDRNA2_/TRDRNA2_107212_c1_seq1:83-913(+)
MAAGDTARCIEFAVQAANLENKAMDFDRTGQIKEAVAEYRLAAAKLEEAAAACPERHADKPVLKLHAEEVASRAAYLEGLDGASDTVLPLEEHIHSVQLTIGMSESAEAAAAAAGDSEDGDGRKHVMGAAAAIGGVAGLVLFGPVGALALAAGSAYATTREDKLGHGARKVGGAGLEVVTQAQKFDEEHRISQRVLDTTQKTRESISCQASALDAKYAIRERLTLGASQTQQAFSSLDEKHKVSEKLKSSAAVVSSFSTQLLNKAEAKRKDCFSRG